MAHRSRFIGLWEPLLLEEEELARGKWTYVDGTEYIARFIRQRWDYCCDDFEEIEKNADDITMDYVDYSIGKDGNVFFWRFEGPASRPESRHFSTAADAHAHLFTYAGKADDSLLGYEG